MGSQFEPPQYTPRQVTMALQQLVRNHGDEEKTASELIGDEFMVSRGLLVNWRTEEHAEQYRRIEEGLRSEVEANAVAQLPEIILRANVARLEMIERVRAITDERLLPQALRALNDASNKATSQLLAHTGRPIDGKTGEAGADAMVRLLTGMAERNLIRLNPVVQGALEAHAEEIDVEDTKEG